MEEEERKASSLYVITVMNSDVEQGRLHTGWWHRTWSTVLGQCV